MIQLFKFTPSHSVANTINPNPETMNLIQEPMVYSASEGFAWDFGGPLTRAVITRIKDSDQFARDRVVAYQCGLNILIDTRVHMLMKGQYPAIGGWHCDFYPRGGNGQPDVMKGNDASVHYVTTLSDNEEGVSCTEFVDELVLAEVDAERVWRSVHLAVEDVKPRTFKAKDGDILRFSQETIHRATPTVNSGWRFFLRLSFCDIKPQNQIRRQVQVYTPPENGW